MVGKQAMMMGLICDDEHNYDEHNYVTQSHNEASRKKIKIKCLLF